MTCDPRDPAWYWDEFDAALRPRAGALAVVAAALMAVWTLPGVARPVRTDASPAAAPAPLPPCHLSTPTET